MARLAEGAHDALANRFQQRILGVREHEDELLTAITGDDVGAAHVGFENVRRRHEDLVTHRVPVRIVDRLEFVEIRERDAERRVALVC